MPVVKREESPEPPIAPIAPIAPTVSLARPSRSSKTSKWFQRKDAVNTKPSMPPPQGAPIARQAHLAPGPYDGSSPRKYRFSSVNNMDRLSGSKQRLLFEGLPSRPSSAVATGRVNKSTSMARTTTRGRPPTLPNIKLLTQPLQHIHRIAHAEPTSMDENKYESDGDQGDYGDHGFPEHPPMAVDDDQAIVISGAALNHVQYHVQVLQNAHTASEMKLREQDGLIRELIMFNQHMHSSVQDLNKRLANVESARVFGHNSAIQGRTPGFSGGADGRSRSPSPTGRGYRDREAPLISKKIRGRKQLQIQLPGKMYQPADVGLQTPITSFTSATPVRTPKTPLTPGRIGPPTSGRCTNTCINKRGIHNLDKMVPPTYAQFPLLPLTDTEIIVYFFNSLARPVVSLRLYAREWGPLQICETLNSHRTIEPEYLRNTCSVKCTTAIKKGRERYGNIWEPTTRMVFEDKILCTDDKATDMIRLAPDELHLAVDYDIRALCQGLKKHPNEQDGGIFTRCVKWCQENDAAYKLSNVWELASDLDAGCTPKRVVSNTSTSSSGSSQIFASKFKSSNRGKTKTEVDKDNRRVSRAMRQASDGAVFGGDDDKPPVQPSV